MNRTASVVVAGLVALLFAAVVDCAHAQRYADPKGQPLTSPERFHLGIGLTGEFDDVRTLALSEADPVWHLTPKVEYAMLSWLHLEARAPIPLSNDAKPGFTFGIFLQR